MSFFGNPTDKLCLIF